MAREFDLYWCTDDDGTISPYSSSICENTEPWFEGCHWAKPNARVIEFSAYQNLERKLETAIAYIKLTPCSPARYGLEATLEGYGHDPNCTRCKTLELMKTNELLTTTNASSEETCASEKER